MPCTLAQWHTRHAEWRQWHAQRRQLKQQLRSAFTSAFVAAPAVSHGPAQPAPTLSATDARLLRTERNLTLHRLGWWLATAAVLGAVALAWLGA